MNLRIGFSALLLIVITFSFSSAQQNDTALAKVNPRLNKLPFLWSQPIHDYEVVFVFKNSIQYVNCLSPMQIIDNSIKNATTEAKPSQKISTFASEDFYA